MKLLFWNCQGVGQPLRIRHLRGLECQHCPNFVFLMEIKANQTYMAKIRQKLNFQHKWAIPSKGKSGCLTLFWSDSSQIQLIHSTKDIIDARILHPSSPTWWRLTCIYGNSIYSERLAQWNALWAKGNRINDPLLCIDERYRIGGPLFRWEYFGRKKGKNSRKMCFFCQRGPNSNCLEKLRF